MKHASLFEGEYTHTSERGFAGFLGAFSRTANAAYDEHDRRKGGMFVRHHELSRAEIIVYNVQTWIDRDLAAQRAADAAAPHDCVRVKLSSLRELATKRPEFALPSRLPAAHLEKDKEESAANTQLQEREVEGDDPPAPIPAGFKQVDWDCGTQSVVDFMIWTKLDRGPAKWHQAKVHRALPPNFRGGFTHEATFAKLKGVRGVQLTIEAYGDGCWVPIQPCEQQAILSDLNSAEPRSSSARGVSSSGGAKPKSKRAKTR